MSSSKNRSWMITIPVDSITKEDLLKKLSPYTYVGQMEKGEETGYIHWQIYIENKTQIKFQTLKNKFPKGHFKVRWGTKKQCYDYCTKSKTAFPDTRIEKGDIDLTETNAPKVTVEAAVDLMKRGMRADEVLLQYPSLWRSMNYLDRVQTVIDAGEYSTKKRNLKVNYIYGAPGTGKTTSIYEEHDFKEVFRVSNYKNPFDDYNAEPVLVLDEFYSSIPLDDILNVLDVWPFKMSARYNDRWAAYETVYIISNIALPQQYATHGFYSEDRLKSFYRRISDNYHMVGGERVLWNSWLDQQVPPEKRL